VGHEWADEGQRRTRSIVRTLASAT